MNLAIGIAALVAVALLVHWTRQNGLRHVARERLETGMPQIGPSALAGTPPSGVPDGKTERWLFLAGYRSPDAVSRFWWQTILCALIGGVLGFVLVISGASERLQLDLEGIPGGVGYLFVPVVIILPFLLAFVGAAIPTWRVRRARRTRVHQILTDLYPALELFASLAQAGLAFDGALARIVATLDSDRPLARELVTFRAEIMSGAPRSQCFRRLAGRISLSQMSSFTAALIRAHEVGIGLSQTLRRQADELRSELRERALARAQSLPARLVFPLVICFLPGIFVMSLGPAFYGFLTGTSGFGVTR